MHTSLGAKACTPEINTSEIIVDFRGVFQRNLIIARIFQRIVTFPVDFHRICPTDVRCRFPTEFHFCDFWRAIVCPEKGLAAADNNNNNNK